MARGTQSRPFETTLRKHAYSNILKILQRKKENILTKKKSDIFQISVQNIDCGHSLEPPRAEIRKIMYTPVNPSFFFYIKVGFKGGQIYIGMFSWWHIWHRNTERAGVQI